VTKRMSAVTEKMLLGSEMDNEETDSREEITPTSVVLFEVLREHIFLLILMELLC